VYGTNKLVLDKQTTERIMDDKSRVLVKVKYLQTLYEKWPQN